MPTLPITKCIALVHIILQGPHTGHINNWTYTRIYISLVFFYIMYFLFVSLVRVHNVKYAAYLCCFCCLCYTKVHYGVGRKGRRRDEFQDFETLLSISYFAFSFCEMYNFSHSCFLWKEFDRMLREMIPFDVLGVLKPDVCAWERTKKDVFSFLINLKEFLGARCMRFYYLFVVC